MLGKGEVGFLTAPDEKTLLEAKIEAEKLFPADKQSQRDYWLTKGAATMRMGVIKDYSFLGTAQPLTPTPQS